MSGRYKVSDSSKVVPFNPTPPTSPHSVSRSVPAACFTRLHPAAPPFAFREVRWDTLTVPFGCVGWDPGGGRARSCVCGGPQPGLHVDDVSAHVHRRSKRSRVHVVVMACRSASPPFPLLSSSRRQAGV